MKTLLKNSPAIYVGTYGKYNNGSIAGKWINPLDYSDKDEFLKACAELHKDEKDPEFMFQDFENIHEDFISECHIGEEFWEFANTDIDIPIEVLCEYASNYGYNLLEAAEKIEDEYCGCHDSFLDYAEQLADETMEIPKNIQIYFDYKAFARDLEHDFFTISTDEGVYIWWN